MSWKPRNAGLAPFDIDVLYRYNWDSNDDCTLWWRVGYPEQTYTFEEAVQAFEDQMSAED